MKQRTVFPMKKIIIFFLLTFLMPFTSQGETGYVTDMLILTVKEGPGNEYGIINTLRSNTRVDILNKSGNFYQIKTSEGDEGWVESQYITTEIPKSIIIENLKAKIASLEKTNSNTGKNAELKDSTWETKMESLKKNHEEEKTNLESSLKIAQEKNIKLEKIAEQAEKKYKVLADQSENLVNIIKENKKLIRKNSLIEDELKKLKLKNDDSTKTAMIKWFLAGAGVLLIGWLIGLSIRSSRKKRNGLL